jgi:hypothetical protein
MTLIIGRVVNEKIYIFGDTALTYNNFRKANPFSEGCLKQYMVTDKLAIAFADDSQDFEDICQKLFSASNACELINIAINAQKSGKNFELLIGEVGYKNIRTVKEGIVNEAPSGYIGDKVGFESFQKYFHAPTNCVITNPPDRAAIQILRYPEPIIEDEIYGRFYEALKQVILDERVPSVGGLIIPLCTDNGKFCYINYVDITSDPVSLSEFKAGLTVIEFGTPAKGGYSVEFCNDIPYDGQGNNIGYYFLQGGFGIAFPPTQTGFRIPKIVPAENPAYWILETKKLLGYGIGCGFLTADHCAIAGEKLLQQDKAEDALFCYELRKNDKSLTHRPALQDRYVSGHATAMFNCDTSQQTAAIQMLEEFINTHSIALSCKRQLQRMLALYTQPRN